MFYKKLVQLQEGTKEETGNCLSYPVSFTGESPIMCLSQQQCTLLLIFSDLVFDVAEGVFNSGFSPSL